MYDHFDRKYAEKLGGFAIAGTFVLFIRLQRRARVSAPSQRLATYPARISSALSDLFRNKHQQDQEQQQPSQSGDFLVPLTTASEARAVVRHFHPPRSTTPISPTLSPSLINHIGTRILSRHVDEPREKY